MPDTGPSNSVVARFPKRPSRGVLLGFSGPRLCAIGLAGALAVAGLVVSNLAGLLAAGLMWGPILAAAFVRVDGRPAAEWAATAIHFWGRQASGQTEYRARLPLRPRPAATLALPGDAASLRLHEDADSAAVMVHDPHRQSLSGILSVSHPAFVLLDHADQAQRVSRWGRLLSALAQSGSASVLQVLEAVVPDRGDGLCEWYEAHGRSDRSFADVEYRRLLERARLGSSIHRTTLSLALDLKVSSRAVKAAGGGLRGAAALLRQDLAALADAGRQAGLSVGPPLSAPELAAMIRAAYDPAVSLDPRVDPGANLSRAGPLAVSEHWDRLRHDSGYSAVLWVSEWPRVEVPPDVLHGLVFAPGVRRSLSLLYRPVASEEALRQIRKEKTSALADQAQKAKVGQVAELADHAEYEDLLARERSVVAGHTDVEFAGLVTVSALSEDDLEAARAAMVRAAGSAACELRPLHGRQAQGFVVGALPLARSVF